MDQIAHRVTFSAVVYLQISLEINDISVGDQLHSTAGVHTIERYFSRWRIGRQFLRSIRMIFSDASFLQGDIITG